MSGAGQAMDVDRVGYSNVDPKAKSKALRNSAVAQASDLGGLSGGRSNCVRKKGSVSIDHVLLALRETKDERDLRIRSLFNFFDAANNGYLDYAQIEAGLSALQIPSEYKYAKELFKVCDANRDGRIDYHEFRRYMDDKELELYRIFQAIDVEHNGCILPEELWDALVKAGNLLADPLSLCARVRLFFPSRCIQFCFCHGLLRYCLSSVTLRFCFYLHQDLTYYNGRFFCSVCFYAWKFLLMQFFSRGFVPLSFCFSESRHSYITLSQPKLSLLVALTSRLRNLDDGKLKPL